MTGNEDKRCFLVLYSYSVLLIKFIFSIVAAKAELD